MSRISCHTKVSHQVWIISKYIVCFPLSQLVIPLHQTLALAKAKASCDSLGPGSELGLNQKLAVAKAKASDCLGQGSIWPWAHWGPRKYSSISRYILIDAFVT